MSKQEHFTNVTTRFIDSLNLEDRKKVGQYMTPQFLGQRMAQKLSTPSGSSKVLDPAVGTAELLLSYKKVHGLTPETAYYGWDVDKNLLKTAKTNFPEGTFEEHSLFNPLNSELMGYFDHIIGNPPYFEIKKDDPALKNCDLTTLNEKGRLNIYALFFEYALKLLKIGGEMVFLVPPSMNNGAYFTLTRRNILENAVINSIEIVKENSHFADALTSVQIIHLTKTADSYENNLKESAPWVVNFNEVTQTPVTEVTLPTIFTADKETITNQWSNSYNLNQLGFKVSTGKIPWNQVKDLFLPEEEYDEGIPLLYSKDIDVNNQLSLKSALDDRRYLPADYTHSQEGQKIIVNRIIGALTNPNLRFCLVDLTTKYVTENHVNVIEPAESETSVSLDNLAQQLAASNVWLGKYLSSLSGNTQLSAKELAYLIPFKK